MNEQTNNQVKIGPSQHFLNFDSDADADAVADAEADADAELSNYNCKQLLDVLIILVSKGFLNLGSL